MTPPRFADPLVRAAAAVLPLPGDPDRRRALAAELKRSLPVLLWIALHAIVRVLWILASISRRGQATREAAFAAWVSVWSQSRSPLLRNLGVWVKTAGCMLVLGDPEVREQIYVQRGLKPPAATVVGTGAASARPAADEVIDGADYIVVGSGPTGATVARTLRQAGKEVLVLEEGSDAPAAYGAAATSTALTERFRGAAMFTTGGPERIPILQGRCVGGSSTVNSAIAWRAPQRVFDAWREDARIAELLPQRRLDAAYDAIERALPPVATSGEALGRSNELMASAARTLGVHGKPTDRYTRECLGLGRCIEGCPLGRKLSMNATFVPELVAAGGRLVPNCQVMQVEFEGARAVGVRARWGGRTVRIAARRAVVLAASAIQTPILLRRSGILHPLVGRRLQAHPGGSLVGVFRDAVRPPLGATQGYQVDHWLEEGFKIEVLTLPDELQAARMAGTGAALVETLAQVPYAVVWAVPIRARALGSVGGSQRFPRVSFHLTPQDCVTLGRGLYEMGRLLFAAGATEIMPNIVGLPARVSDPAALASLNDGVSPTRLSMTMSHLFGTAIMGRDPGQNVCDANGAVYGVEGLVVADSSLFPTNLGVNPQHTIMAVAQHVAWALVGD